MDWTKVYGPLNEKSSPYGRLYHWLILALHCKGFKTHAWREKGYALFAFMEKHKKALPYSEGPAAVRSAIMRYLLDHDNPLTLAVFLMPINPEGYAPKVGTKFERWSWPKTAYEGDHGGQFIETSRNLYVYSGGETKWSHNSMYPNNLPLVTTVVQDAWKQIEELVRIIDVLMNFGYRKRTMFAMRVFVPTLGSSQIDAKVNRQIKVIRRRRLPEGVDKSVQTVLGEGGLDGNEDQKRREMMQVVMMMKFRFYSLKSLNIWSRRRPWKLRM